MSLEGLLKMMFSSPYSGMEPRGLCFSKNLRSSLFLFVGATYFLDLFLFISIYLSISLFTYLFTSLGLEWALSTTAQSTIYLVFSSSLPVVSHDKAT